MIVPREVPQEFIDRRRAQRMQAVDALSPDLRHLVHEYGYKVVRAFLDCGVTKPNHIKHLVETVLDEFSPTRGSRAAQGPRSFEQAARIAKGKERAP